MGYATIYYIFLVFLKIGISLPGTYLFLFYFLRSYMNPVFPSSLKRLFCKCLTPLPIPCTPTYLFYEGDDEVAAPESGPAVRGVQQKQAYLHHHRIYEGDHSFKSSGSGIFRPKIATVLLKIKTKSKMSVRKTVFFILLVLNLLFLPPKLLRCHSASGFEMNSNL
jgi:hypothetical protein